MTTRREHASREGLTAQLIDSFKDMLSRGVLQWGTKLPPERELAQKFGVSRVSLRHALKALELFGLISQRVGDGTYLTSDPSKVLEPSLEFLFLVDEISPMDVVDTRLIFEPELAAAAARNARAENLEEIGQILTKMSSSKSNSERNELDLAFHEAIFRASGNKLTTRIVSILHRSMLDNMSVTSRMVDPEHTISFHQPIYKAIQARDEAAARKFMHRHLVDGRRLLENARGRKSQDRTADLPIPTLKRRS